MRTKSAVAVQSHLSRLLLPICRVSGHVAMRSIRKELLTMQL